MRALPSAIVLGCIMALANVALAATQQDYADCQQGSDIDRSIAACSRIVSDLTISANDRAVMHIRRGYGYFIKNNLDAAIADYTEAIRLDEKNVYGYINRAIGYARKGERDRALADYRRAKILDP